MPAGGAAAAGARTSVAGPVVGSLIGLGLVGVLAFYAWRQRDVLAAQLRLLVGGGRPPIVNNDELLASAYENVGAGGGGGGGGGGGANAGAGGGYGGGGDLYASL